MGGSQVDHDCSYLSRTVLRESLGNIGLAQVVPPQKFITLSENIERLGVVLGQEGDLESASPIENAAVVEDGLGPHQDAVHAMHIVACFVVADELASHALQHQLVVEFRAQYHMLYPSSRMPLLQTNTNKLSSKALASFRRLSTTDFE